MATEWTLSATKDEAMIRVEGHRNFDEEGRPGEVVALVEYPVGHPQIAGLDEEALGEKLKAEAREALERHAAPEASAEELSINGDNIAV